MIDSTPMSFFAFLFLCIITACGTDEPKPEAERPAVTLESSAVTVDADAQSSCTVSVASNVRWAVVVSEAWCECTPTTGVGTVTLTVKATSANEGNRPRTAGIIFEAANGETSAFLSVTQRGRETVTPPEEMARSLDDFNRMQAAAKEGSVIVWGNGSYPIDGLMTVNKDGLTIKAQTDGGVVFTGAMQVKVLADGITFRGFRFENGILDRSATGEKDLLTVGNGTSNSSAKTTVPAAKGHHNRFEQLVFYNVACRQMVCITPGASHNVFAHCRFEAKPKIPANSVFQIQVATQQPGYNVIRYCSFKNFISGASGDYGMEAVRIGYSHQKDNVSRDVVEYCYFYRCGGDDEIISSKATETVYRYNTFADNSFTDAGITYKSHLTLRHGHKSAVYGNFFLNGRGVRICEGTGHLVYNNYFHTGAQWPLRIDNRDANGGLDFADAVTNLSVLHNTFTGCAALELHSGNAAHQTAPANVTLANNIFSGMTASSLTKYRTGNENFSGNILYPDVANGKPAAGLTIADPQLLANAYGYMQLQSSGSAAVDRSSADYPALWTLPDVSTDAGILWDVMQNARPDNRTQKDVGNFEWGGAQPVRPHATADNTGTNYEWRVESGE